MSNPGSQSNAEDDEISLLVTATDLEETEFLYSATGLPPGLVINPRTGEIWGWIDPRAEGTYNVTVYADDFEDVGSAAFTWTVSDTNHDPHLFREGHRLWHVGDSFPGGGPQALDIDEDSLSYWMADLPPGISYDPQTNWISGSATTPGTYTVSYGVDDGQGGTAGDTFLWRVLPAGQNIPVTWVDIGDTEGNDITTVHPAEPIEADISFSYPDDPFTLYEVTLAVTPAGRSVIDTPVLMMQHGDIVTVNITPLAVSQLPEDVVITASVTGSVKRVERI